MNAITVWIIMVFTILLSFFFSLIVNSVTRFDNLCPEYYLEIGDIVEWKVDTNVRGEVIRCLYSDKIIVNVGDRHVTWTLMNTIKE